MDFIETPRFPLCPSFGIQGGPEFSVTVVSAGNGREVRNLNWSEAKRSYIVTIGPREDEQFEILLEHFETIGGKHIGFRFKDYKDFRSCPPYQIPNFTDQSVLIIGNGSGSDLLFQLAKTRTSGDLKRTRRIQKPVDGTVTIGVDGVQLLTGWDVDSTTGLITFDDPPDASSLVTAGFEFDVPVRYDVDQLSWTIQDRRATAASFALIEVRL